MTRIHHPAALAALLLSGSLQANNLSVSSAVLVDPDNTAGHVDVRFTVSWEHSWRTTSAPYNWDAAWVFVKYRTQDGVWHHARLGSDAQHVAPAGSTVNTGLLTPGSAYDAASNWGVGAFVYRSANGTGTFTASNVRLRWNYAQNGIAYTDIASASVFAVEMVYVPEGIFYLGSGGSENRHFKNGTTNDPYLVTSEGAITMANTNGALWSLDGTEVATLPAAFPKGHAAFYIMKHELAQQNYVDFLNTLTRAQQNTRVSTNVEAGITSVTAPYVMQSNGTGVLYRNGIRCNTTIDANAPITFYCDRNGNGTGNQPTDGQWVACNLLGWADLAAWLDWSGLRPMTELEYEKAGRGDLAPVANEYAWGGTNLTQATGVSNNGATNETATPGGANANYSINNDNPIQGPVRTGAFTALLSWRNSSGAGRTGALELSGNLWELTITVDNAAGRAFAAVLGNGTLDATGNADVATWPGTGAVGTGLRGGGWDSNATYMPISSRSSAATGAVGRSRTYGGRGVR